LKQRGGVGLRQEREGGPKQKGLHTDMAGGEGEKGLRDLDKVIWSAPKEKREKS